MPTTPRPNSPVPMRRLAILATVALAAIALAVLTAWWLGRLPEFDDSAAFAHLEKQVAFGPRVPGSDDHTECGDWLVSTLQGYADRVHQQEIAFSDRRDSSRVWNGRNIVAAFNLAPRRNFRVLLCAHWDSRPWADRDPDSTRHDDPVPGANDGASGVAVLLEMARILKEHPLDFGVDIVLFDLEDIGDYGAAPDSDSLNPFSIGAREFVDRLPRYRPAFGILVDMVGDADLRLPREGFSWSRASRVVQQVWAAADDAGAPAFVAESGDPVIDDHVPFLEKGIPVINIIDFDYPYWHTIEDTPDKCSPESLGQVGRTLVQTLYTY